MPLYHIVINVLYQGAKIAIYSAQGSAQRLPSTYTRLTYSLLMWASQALGFCIYLMTCCTLMVFIQICFQLLIFRIVRL